MVMPRNLPARPDQLHRQRCGHRGRVKLEKELDRDIMKRELADPGSTVAERASLSPALAAQH